MTREELETYIFQVYGVEPEYPWLSNPEYAVFRHFGNRKWFAVIMDIPKKRLGLWEDGIIDIVNVKCDPAMIGALYLEPGFFPAYHMSKTHWISIALDGTADADKITGLLDMSYDLTVPRRKRP